MLQSSWSCRLKFIPKMVMDMHRDYINLHYKCEKWIKMYFFHITINSQTRKDEIVSVTSSIFILWKIHRVLTKAWSPEKVYLQYLTGKTYKTRQYSWGMQWLVSTHFGVGGILGYTKLKVPSPDQIFMWGRGDILGYSKLKVPSPDQVFMWGRGDILGYSKLKVPSPDQVFMWGRGYSWLFWIQHSSNTWVGALKEFCTKILPA